MTLNGVMAVILRYYTECVTFEPLVKGDNLTNTARLLENGAR